MATLFDLGQFSPGPLDMQAIARAAYGNENLGNCSGLNLTVYCLQTIDQNGYVGWDPGNGANAALGLSLFVLAIAVAEHGHAFTHPSTNETRTWLLKVYDNCVVDLFSLRGFELI